MTTHTHIHAGGTEDMAAVFEDLCARYPNTKFLGYGFSLGACILIRFLGEKKERQSKFLCAASLCQGYDPSMLVCVYHSMRESFFMCISV